MTHLPGAEAGPAKGVIVLEDLPSHDTTTLPLDILRRVARDRAAKGDPITCADLRHCDDLTLHGVSVDLDGDGANEWFVTDSGFTGSGAELDYIFKARSRRRWTMIGRVEGLHLMTVSPKKHGGFRDIEGYVAGICVDGRGKAVWNGRRYVVREGRTSPRPC